MLTLERAHQSCHSPGSEQKNLTIVVLSHCLYRNLAVALSTIRTSHIAATDTEANRCSQYVPGGNAMATPSRQRDRASTYAETNSRLRCNASTLAHLFSVAMRGRKFRRGSRLPG